MQQRRLEVIRSYSELWDRIIAEWHQPGLEDRAWLMHSANCLLRTAGTGWAIDPITLSSRLPAAPAVEAARDLGDLSFILLTHRHADHLDLPLLRSLRHAPIHWVIPETLQAEVISESGLPTAQIITPQPMQPITLRGVNIWPFDGLHWETAAGGARGVPALGYCVEFNVTWLICQECAK